MPFPDSTEPKETRRPLIKGIVVHVVVIYGLGPAPAVFGPFPSHDAARLWAYKYHRESPYQVTELRDPEE